MILGASIGLMRYFGEVGQQRFKPTESPDCIHAASFMARSAARTGKKTGNMSYCSVHQVIPKVSDKLGALILKCFLERLVGVTESQSELGLQSFTVGPAAGGVVPIGRLPGHLHVELLDPNGTLLSYFAKFLLVKEIRLVEECWVTLYLLSVPLVRFDS